MVAAFGVGSPMMNVTSKVSLVSLPPVIPLPRVLTCEVLRLLASFRLGDVPLRGRGGGV